MTSVPVTPPLAIFEASHFDKIKIDRSFVHDLQREDSRRLFVLSPGLGVSLGMAITGEGVETNAEAEYLRREGCTEARGFFWWLADAGKRRV